MPVGKKAKIGVGDFTLLTKTEEYIPNKVLTLVVDEDMLRRTRF